MTVSKKAVLFIATGAFTGKIPLAPGTFGTLAGIPFALLLIWIPPAFAAAYLTGLVLAAIWIAGMAETIIGQKDPGCIVIDEIAGFAIAMSTVPVSWLSLAIGFLVFRVFDIAKPFPVKWFESNLPGGAGIVLDDVVAGLYSGIILGVLNSLDFI